MKIVMAGQGAFGQKHLDAIKLIEGVEVVSLAGGRAETTEQVAAKYAIPHWIWAKRCASPAPKP
jgi:2-hydroxy-4-carboxymuconate semialdehyde hemiacetal dehydrogenase